MEPALFWEQHEKGVKCRLCPHECIIPEGRRGLCRVRENVKGKLFTCAYSNPCSAAVDPIEKKPLFHFLPGSETFSISIAGCNLRCLNCQNFEISQASPEESAIMQLEPERAVEEAVKRECDSICFTYTEPTVFYEYMLDVSRIAKEEGLKVVLVSNGYINEKPLKGLKGLIDAVNVDLKAFDEETYLRLCGAHLKPVLNTLKALRKMKVWVEVTNLIVPGYTDDIDAVGKMCEWVSKELGNDTPIHFSRFFPLYKLSGSRETSLQLLEMARDSASSAGLRHVYIGNTHKSTDSDTFCPECKKPVIERGFYSVKKTALEKGRCTSCGHKIPGVFSDKAK